MNKIYKVIWSKVRNCYVAVSEIAKGGNAAGRRVFRITAGVRCIGCAGDADAGL